MINIQKFECNMLRENCYVVSDDSKQCVVIDCGVFYPEERAALLQYIDGQQLVPVRLLSTHGHFDHNCGNNTIYEKYNIGPELSHQDKALIESLPQQALSFTGNALEVTCPPVRHYFDEGEVITFGHHRLEVVQTPGHSRGSVCFLCRDEKVLFSGDTLFRHSIGRTDFPGGSMLQIIQSLRMLAQMPDDITVLPGHGEPTSIGEEVAHNPYIDR